MNTKKIQSHLELYLTWRHGCFSEKALFGRRDCIDENVRKINKYMITKKTNMEYNQNGTHGRGGGALAFGINIGKEKNKQSFVGRKRRRKKKN